MVETLTPAEFLVRIGAKMGDNYTTPEDILTYYLQGMEQTRLSSGAGLLEYLRTRELLARYLP